MLQARILGKLSPLPPTPFPPLPHCCCVVLYCKKSCNRARKLILVFLEPDKITFIENTSNNCFKSWEASLRTTKIIKYQGWGVFTKLWEAALCYPRLLYILRKNVTLSLVLSLMITDNIKYNTGAYKKGSVCRVLRQMARQILLSLIFWVPSFPLHFQIQNPINREAKAAFGWKSWKRQEQWLRYT